MFSVAVAVQKAEAVTSNVLDEERKSAISSMKQQDISEEEDEKNKAEVKPTTMNQSSANQVYGITVKDRE